jgi:hypothetical protein
MTVEAPFTPVSTVTLDGLTAKAKSCTVTLTVAE